MKRGTREREGGRMEHEGTNEPARSSLSRLLRNKVLHFSSYPEVTYQSGHRSREDPRLAQFDWLIEAEPCLEFGTCPAPLIALKP